MPAMRHNVVGLHESARYLGPYRKCCLHWSGGFDLLATVQELTTSYMWSTARMLALLL